MKLIIEFPMNIICAYNGADNLDETLDDNISYLLGKHCYDNGVEFKILSLDFVQPKPNINDELIRYQVEMGLDQIDFKTEWILGELKHGNFEKGLTIKSVNDEILYADEYTADLRFRRALWKSKGVANKT